MFFGNVTNIIFHTILQTEHKYIEQIYIYIKMYIVENYRLRLNLILEFPFVGGQKTTLI